MFKNMKVRKSLLIGFGTTIIISLGLIISSIVVMNLLSKGYDEILDRNVHSTELISSIRLEANIAARNVRDIALIPNDPNNPALEARARECISNMNSHFSELEKHFPLDKSLLSDAFKFVKEEMMCRVSSYKDKVFAVEPPMFVELEIAECEPGVRGDTATGATKNATLETGAVIRVPLFINEGEKIRIDTRTGEYIERA